MVLEIVIEMEIRPLRIREDSDASVTSNANDLLIVGLKVAAHAPTPPLSRGLPHGPFLYIRV